MLFKPQIIRLEQREFKGDFDRNEVLFVRVSDEIRKKNVFVEVPSTHTAIAVIGGKYKYMTQSGPLLESAEEIKSYKMGLSIDVIYIAKDTKAEFEWGTPSELTLRDVPSGRVIKIASYGKAEVSVSNPEMFYRKIVGVTREFNIGVLSDRVRSAVVDRFADIFLHAVQSLNLSYDMYDLNRAQIGRCMCGELGPVFDAQWGLKIDSFTISAVTVKNDDIEAMEEVYDPRRGMRTAAAQSATGMTKCPSCGAFSVAGSMFCSKCGADLGVAPKVCSACGHINGNGAAFCAICGNKL